MEKHSFSIPKISCGHCVMAIKNELSEMTGVNSVEGDPGTKRITVEWTTPVTEATIRNKLRTINYPAD